jgi:ABC-type transport system involved in multi-copper enzyme maturation permease subunit
MVIEHPLPHFVEWFPAAALSWLLVVAVLAVAALAVGCLVSVLRYGPRVGLGSALETAGTGVLDLVCMSPRRLGALAWLAVKESIRRRVVMVFGLFVVILLFAGWFLDVGSSDPAKLYLSFVLTATTYLVLLLALFLSAFSLPADVKSRTIQTVVTKPVRASEIVLGRMLGFTIVGTVLLAVMSGVSYVFVIRGVAHTHEVLTDSFKPVGAAVEGKQRPTSGTTDSAQGHRHKIYVDSSGVGHVETEFGHWHEIEPAGSGDKNAYSVQGPEGMLQARVPVYGKLRFRDREGKDVDRGINVGDEWFYRSFIQGGSPAAAIWTFSNVREARFEEGLPVDMNIEIFRTYKGNIEKGVIGSLSLRNPRTGLIVEVKVFEAKEFAPLTIFVPRKITQFSSADVIASKRETPDAGVEYSPPQNMLDRRLAERKEFDLFNDLVADGDLEIWVRCLEPSQYFGGGQPDLWLHAADAAFTVNFFKGYFGIWLQMVLVVGFGVMFSTFLSGPVAMLATVGAMIGGFFSDFLTKLSQHAVLGGGPIEALIRLVRQDNLMTEMEPGLRTTATQMADRVAEAGLWVIARILPPFTEFNYADWVAYGFDVSWDPWIAVPALRALAFLIPVFVAGCFFLKTREVAQ